MSVVVSVIISTYNGKTRGFVQHAIRSVLSQTYPRTEILVVDDGSTDGTAEHVATMFPQVTVLRKTNGGISSARNHGIRAAKGDYLAILDDDDEWAPSKLERQLQWFQRPENRDALVVFSNAEIINAKGVVTGQTNAFTAALNWPALLMTYHAFGGASSSLFKKEVVEKVGLFDESLPRCEDFDYYLRVVKSGGITFVPEALVRIRQHDNQMTHDLRTIHAHTIAVMRKHGKDVSDTIFKQALTYYCLGGVFRAAFVKDYHECFRMLTTEGVKYYRVDMLLIRLIGMLLVKLGYQQLKVLWRTLEYKLYAPKPITARAATAPPAVR